MVVFETAHKDIIEGFICAICDQFAEDPVIVELQYSPYCDHIVCRKCLEWETTEYGDAHCKRCDIIFSEEDTHSLQGCLKTIYEKLCKNMKNEHFAKWVSKEYGEDFTKYHILKHTTREKEPFVGSRNSIQIQKKQSTLKQKLSQS